ncbi:MAG: MBL fold metallo-hydrolase [Chitinophagaceae bacterium]
MAKSKNSLTKNSITKNTITKNSLTKKALSENLISRNVFAVAPGVWRMKDIFVNVFIIQNIDGTNWVLVDAGLKTSAPKIKNMGMEVFGSSSKPSSIILTHGHFDHVGSLQKLAGEWGVPVYAHRMELAYLTGKSSYPPPDSTVGGGMMATMSFLYPKGPIDIGQIVRELPEDGSIPELPGWKWLHTPGHTNGHISLFREEDKVLIAGDAVVTTNAQSAIAAVFTQKEELNGPPRYLTTDWGLAAKSVKSLAALKPEVVASGHGHSLYGTDVKKQLNKLSRHFWELAMPASGRYVTEPALADENGITYLPPARPNYPLYALLSVTALGILTYVLYKRKRNRFSF